MITANEARKAMMKVLQERENRENELAQNWVHDVVNAAVAQAVERAKGIPPLFKRTARTSQSERNKC